ncbi:TPA: hypothetical protein N0F65_004086 [Lagenidium giganteum]|uniref:1-phosphatidylinositol 4-kinase n=1 Tax=Lagenidium giganteum TaxID=4803 RepID=A0AAV2Z061_9STRA|nr:TPA: hypothetical protein N0F65_004086 [Lagenidium giganteum]
MAKKTVSEKALSVSTKEADSPDAAAEDEVSIEGFLFIRIHVRRRRYCILQGRALHVFNSKEESRTASGALNVAKKTVVVVGVKDAMDFEKAMRASLLGSNTAAAAEHALIISTRKSKLVVVEAETKTEKQRWVHAMSCLNFASSASERSFFVSMLQESTQFDAHAAVSLLHKYRDNATATELIIDRLAEYTEQDIDDVEFYIPQIMHLVVNMEMTRTEKLVNLLLSICKATSYVEHLGNAIHLALQLFWLLEAKIQDKDPKTYNLCAKLLMSIEAKVVNQQFELPAGGSVDGVEKILDDIPGIRARLAKYRAQKSENQCEDTAKAAADDKETPDDPTAPAPESNDVTATLTPKELRELLLEWMESERHKRYKYFHEQRDFVKALTDISERMRAIEPPQERKKHLPQQLEALRIPDMAYIPLGRVSDPFCRITRVLRDEGTVFSTHSRAPCLVCFEVIEDHVNAAGKRHATAPRATVAIPAPLRQHSRHSRGTQHRGSVLSCSVASMVDEEEEVTSYIKKYSINGKIICLEKEIEEGEDEDDADEDVETVTLQSIDQHLRVAVDEILAPAAPTAILACSSTEPSPSRESLATSSTASAGDGSNEEDATQLLRRRSKNAYEMGLSRLLTESGVYSESWNCKKERIRASSPYGHLPGWNVISLISKSNDDIRQEVFAMQLISKFQDIFQESCLSLWLRPYRIISTGKSSGLIETITDAQSLDALKKRSDYQCLRKHFERTYGNGDTNSKAFKTAQRNFLHSLVAYSLVCYFLQIKDRHNGNILLDTDGHLIHIDFGFMLGIAPGGNWSMETAPFKLTKEMVAVLGGVSSGLFGEFVHLMCLGMLAAQRNAEKIITIVEIMMRNSTFPCFQGRDVSKELQKLRDRFLLHHPTDKVVKCVIKMISTSYKNNWTKRYDQFQKITNGIIP